VTVDFSARPRESGDPVLSQSAGFPLPPSLRFGGLRPEPVEERVRRRSDRLENGLVLPDELVAQLDKLAGELRIKSLRERG
jgi:hypothetical protein